MTNVKVGDIVITRIEYTLSTIDNLYCGDVPTGTLLTIVEIDDSRVEWSHKRLVFLYKDVICYIMSSEYPLAKQWSGLSHFRRI